MTDLVVVDLSAEETYPLRRTVLRGDTPSTSVTFVEDDWPGTFHLGVRDADALVAISTWIPRPHNDESAIQLRGMATAPGLQGRGVGALLLESGCDRARSIAPLVWARARDTAIPFYLRHGFVVEGEGFIDQHTAKPHHVILRRLH